MSQSAPDAVSAVTGVCATLLSAPTVSTLAEPSAARDTASCGTVIACWFTPSSSRARTNMPGNNVPSGLGNTQRSVTEPVVGSTVMSENSSLPGCA
jgi:hypothetical protein